MKAARLQPDLFHDYTQEFCLVADKHDFCKEPIPLRFPEVPREREFFRRPSKHDLDRGYKVIPRCNGKASQAQDIECPLPKLYDNGFGVLRNNLVRRQDLPKIAKNWILASYLDESCVTFTQFDFDIRDPSPMTRAAVHKEAKRLIGLLRLAHVDCVVTASPGNRYAGQYVRGIYVWVKHDPMRVVDLRRHWQTWLTSNGFTDLEYCWQSKGRLVRIPGQAYMHVLDKGTLEPEDPDETFVETFDHFMEVWSNLSPAADFDLFDDLPRQNPAEPAVVQEVSKKEDSRPEIRCKGYAPIPSIEESQDEPNTFLRATQAKLCSRYIHQVKQGRIGMEDAVEAIKNEMKARAPRNPDGSIHSDTCTNPHLLNKTARRWFSWYNKKYDPQQSTLSPEVKAIREKRDAEDRKRLAYCRDISAKAVARAILWDTSITKRDKKLIVYSGFIYRFVRRMRQYRGRLAYEMLERIAGGRRAWCRIRNILLNTYLRIMEEYDQDQHTCRQWGLTVSVVTGVEKKKTKKGNVDGHECDLSLPCCPTQHDETALSEMLAVINGMNDPTKENLVLWGVG